MPFDAKLHLIRNRYLELNPEILSLYGVINPSFLYDVKMHRNGFMVYSRVCV
jgi:hypothetical protein